jgi:ribose 5-phosphate isomerase B
MQVVLASDHGGFYLKKEIMVFLKQEGIAYHDLGTFSEETVDYPDYALKVAEVIRKGDFEQGILCCGTGIGMVIAANKIPGVRAALCHDCFSARMAREHNDANILTLGQRVIGDGLAIEIVRTWLKAEFQGGRHARRVAKITAIEQKFGKEKND